MISRTDHLFGAGRASSSLGSSFTRASATASYPRWYCSISFLWSTLIRRGVLSQLVSLMSVIFLVAAMPALALFFTALASNFTGGPSPAFVNVVYLLLRTNPFAAIASLIPGFRFPGQLWLQDVPVWVSQVVFYLAATALALFLSLKRLERVRKWI